MVTTMCAFTQVDLDPIVLRVNPSAEQRPAVVARGADVLVQAGAGSGKTRTLVSRYLSLVAEEIPLRAVVAITFTEKAALEMRGRLRAAIRDYLQLPLTSGVRAKWERTARDLDSARIGTIHSLCTEILRRHPAEAVVDPRFAVLDEGQALLLRTNCLDDALAAAVVEEKYAPLFAAKSVDEVRALLEKILEQRLAAAEVVGEDADLAARAYLDVLVADIRAFFVRGTAATCVASLRASAAYAQADAKALGDKAYPMICSALAAWDQAIEADGRGELGAALAALGQVKGLLKKSVGAVANWQAFNPKEDVARLKDTIEETSGKTMPDPAADLRLLALRPLVAAIHADASKRYAEAKQALAALDFDDLEAGALALLRTRLDVRLEWQQQVAALLVDEFQDTNARQAELVQLLRRGPGHLFVVGDAQQSIYGFRGAEMGVFQEARTRVEGEGGVVTELALSYRAHKALIEATETLLRPIFDGGAEATLRARFSPLQAVRATPPELTDTACVEFLLAEGAKAEALPCAADALAARLQLLNAQGVDWGDMAILCRSAGAFTWYEDALERASIASVTVAGRGFYDRPEVRDILNALRAIADPQDNLALVGLLRSPAVAMTDASIMRLCADAPAGPRGARAPGVLWQQLRCDTSLRASEAVALIEELHALAGRVSVAALLEAFLARATYGAALLMAGQTRAARNLSKLIDEARAAPTPSVTDFLERVVALQRATTREGEARADERGAVQIMSVHAAKGLEFPVVVIGDAGSAGRNSAEILYIDPQHGLLFSTKLEGGGEGLLYGAAVLDAKERELAETERILYVAATRARDRLIFSGNVKRGKEGCSTSGWLKAVGASGDIDGLLNRALAEAGAHHSSGCGHFACIVHTPGQPPATAAADTIRSGVIIPSAQPATVIDSWNHRMVEPLTVRGARVERPERPWRVAPEHGDDYAPAWVIVEIVHEAITLWRFPEDSKMPPFDAWANARARARGLHDDNVRSRAVAKCRRLLQLLQEHTLFAEMAAAPRRYHELPYQCATAGDLPDSGRMDLLYMRPGGGWCVIDFKTNHISAMRSVAWNLAHNEYEATLRRYGRAVELLVGSRPELLLCFIDTPEGVQLHQVPFDIP